MSKKNTGANGNRSTNYFPFLIALIIIACAAVGSVLVFASKNFSDVQRWVLVGFIIVFPVFGILIALFGSAISEWLTMREVRKISMTNNRRNTAWDILPPNEQKRKLVAEVKKLAEMMDIPGEQMSDLLSAYIVAEDLALREIQYEEKIPLMRHVSIGGCDYEAILYNEEKLICMDVSFLVEPELKQEKIAEILKRVGQTKIVMSKLRPELKVELLLVLVTQLDKEDETKLRETLGKNRFPNTPVSVDIRLKDFEKLQKHYAI